jgi:hypothetical protein
MFRISSCLPALMALSLTPFAAETAHAEEENAYISAELVLEWQNEYRASSDDPDIDETNNSFVRGELAPTIRLNENWFVDGVLVFEPFDQVGEINAGNDTWFDRNGAFVEELKLNYAAGAFAAWAGKFNPAFGAAWDFGRGIWSEDFAEDYEITERLGVGASYLFDSETAGAQTLSASTFFTDTSVLSQGWVTDRDDVALNDGGAGNTHSLSSFAMSLSGEALAGIKNLGYMLSARYLAEQDKNQDTTTSSERGAAATLTYAFPVNDNLSIDLFAESAFLRDFGGVKGLDTDYYSASAIATFYTNWNLTVGGTRRHIDDNGADRDDDLLQVSGGYDFGNGLTAEVGYRYSHEDDIDTNIGGFLLRYQTGF